MWLAEQSPARQTGRHGARCEPLCYCGGARENKQNKQKKSGDRPTLGGGFGPRNEGRTMTSHLSHRETDDRYHGVIARHGRFRIVVCKDGIQWIVQRKKSGAGGRWEALGYFTTQKALLRLWTALGCPDIAQLGQLPPVFKRSERNDTSIKQECLPAYIGPAQKVQQ
jgi:hypothetical protein